MELDICNLRFTFYHVEWVQLYKKGKVSEVTLRKYNNSRENLIEFGLNIEINEINRIT
jgi:hypothetical protein